MNEREMAELSEVERLLGYAADTDHYCEEENCCVENPQCRDMHLQAALKQLVAAMDPPHKSLQPQRLGNDPERIFLELWQAQNERLSHVNHGFTLLEWILCPSGQKRPERVTHRDAEVAASVIQWLGTSCGLSFFNECERRIADARAVRRQWDQVVLCNSEPTEQEMEVANLIVGRLGENKLRSFLVKDIIGALRAAKKNALKNALTALEAST